MIRSLTQRLISHFTLFGQTFTAGEFLSLSLSNTNLLKNKVMTLAEVYQWWLVAVTRDWSTVMSLPLAWWRDAACALPSRDQDFFPGFLMTGWRGRVRRVSSVRSRRSRGCPRWSVSPRCRPLVAPAGCGGTRAAPARDFLETRWSNGAEWSPSGTWGRRRESSSSAAHTHTDGEDKLTRIR